MLKKSSLIAVFSLFSLSTSGLGAAEDPLRQDSEILKRICEANGLFSLHKAREVTFRFQVQGPGFHTNRFWKWMPQGDSIYLDGKLQPGGRPKEFINDIYWLAFPLMAYDSRDQIAVTAKKNIPSPLAKLSSTEVEVRYTSDKGATPKDAYKLYVDSAMVIREWAYMRQGQEPPMLTTTWEGYQDFQGIRLSLMHKNDKGFKLSFTDVKVVKD